MVYVPGSEKQWADFYMAQALQHGGGAFVGIPYQRGAGLGALFKGIFRSVMPVVKKVGKTVGKAALTTGAQIASDALAGENMGVAAEKRGRAAAKRLIDQAINQMEPQPKRRRRVQKGKGLGIRPTNKVQTSGTVRKGIKAKRGRPKKSDTFGAYDVEID